jgi:N-acetylated-alpha-linked acidic dipeptidase
MLEVAQDWVSCLRKVGTRGEHHPSSWDAEEYGLIGSVEWAEQHADDLKTKVSPESGRSGVGIEFWHQRCHRYGVIRATTRDVKDPKTGQSIYQQWQGGRRETRVDSDAEVTGEARIGALGSGSDYTPFLQHLGVASTDMGFGGDYGVYHSAYDSFYWMENFGDPGFKYHVAVAQVWAQWLRSGR